jgi:hypothetical protein
VLCRAFAHLGKEGSVLAAVLVAQEAAVVAGLVGLEQELRLV